MKRAVSLMATAVIVLHLAACSSAPEEPAYADESFMNALSQGLMARWDEADKPEPAGMDYYSSEYSEYLSNLIDIELASIAEYRNASFEDGKLQEAAISYINVLEDSKEAAELIPIDYEEYSSKWEKAYNERSKAISSFVSEFGLTVDEAHQNILDDFIGTAQKVIADEELQVKIDAMFDALNFQFSETSYSYKTYTATLSNNTGATFDYILLTIDLLDESGTILEQAYASTDMLADGSSIILEFTTDKNFTSYEIHPDYYIQE